MQRWNKNTHISALLDELEALPQYGTRATWVVLDFGCQTVGDVVALSERQLLKHKNFGVHSLRALRQVLAQHKVRVRWRDRRRW
jgi:DNA-directed RNA polymerase alpha subunit